MIYIQVKEVQNPERNIYRYGYIVGGVDSNTIQPITFKSIEEALYHYNGITQDQLICFFDLMTGKPIYIKKQYLREEYHILGD